MTLRYSPEIPSSPGLQRGRGVRTRGAEIAISVAKVGGGKGRVLGVSPFRFGGNAYLCGPICTFAYFSVHPGGRLGVVLCFITSG